MWLEFYKKEHIRGDGAVFQAGMILTQGSGPPGIASEPYLSRMAISQVIDPQETYVSWMNVDGNGDPTDPVLMSKTTIVPIVDEDQSPGISVVQVPSSLPSLHFIINAAYVEITTEDLGGFDGALIRCLSELPMGWSIELHERTVKMDPIEVKVS